MNKIIISESDIIHLQKELEFIKDCLKERQATPNMESTVDSAEAARILGVSKKTLQTYRNRGLIPYSQYGSKIWVKRKDIENFISSHYIKKEA